MAESALFLQLGSAICEITGVLMMANGLAGIARPREIPGLLLRAIRRKPQIEGKLIRALNQEDQATALRGLF